MGSLCARGVEVCEDLRKRKIDVCGLQEVRAKVLDFSEFLGEGINCGSLETALVSKGLEFW